MTDEKPTTDAAPQAEPAAPPIPAALAAADPAKIAALREKLAKLKAAKTKTESGSEAPDAEPVTEGKTMTGKDVDWSEYDLPFETRHLYPQATFRMTPQGPKWVAMVDEFYSAEKSFGNAGQKTQKGDPINLADYLNDMLNSPEGWRLVSLLPASTGRAGVLLQRATPIILPDPKRLKKAEEVEAPREEELARIEEAGLKFAADMGAPAPPVEEPVTPPAAEAGAEAEAALAGDDFDRTEEVEQQYGESEAQ